MRHISGGVVSVILIKYGVCCMAKTFISPSRWSLNMFVAVISSAAKRLTRGRARRWRRRRWRRSSASRRRAKAAGGRGVSPSQTNNGGIENACTRASFGGGVYRCSTSHGRTLHSMVAALHCAFCLRCTHCCLALRTACPGASLHAALPASRASRCAHIFAAICGITATLRAAYTLLHSTSGLTAGGARHAANDWRMDQRCMRGAFADGAQQMMDMDNAAG